MNLIRVTAINTRAYIINAAGHCVIGAYATRTHGLGQVYRQFATIDTIL